MKRRLVDADFKLLKPIGEWKVGYVFRSLGGLVSGVRHENGTSVDFTNKNYFKMINPVYHEL